VRAYGEQDTLRFHFIAHTALDFVEEKGKQHDTRPFTPAYYACARKSKSVTHQSTQRWASGRARSVPAHTSERARSPSAPPSLSISPSLRCLFAVKAQQQGTQQQQQQAGATSKHDSYLGMLYPIDDLQVYGYLSNSNAKLVVVLCEGTGDSEEKDETREAVMKGFFHQLHGLYVDTVANPFHEPNTELHNCTRFVAQVDRIVDFREKELREKGLYLTGPATPSSSRGWTGP
jgi:hypothetical protein